MEFILQEMYIFHLRQFYILIKWSQEADFMRFQRKTFFLIVLIILSGLPLLFMVQPVHACSVLGSPPDAYLVTKNHELGTINEVKLGFSGWCFEKNLLMAVDDNTILLRDKLDIINLYPISNLLSTELTPIQSYNFSNNMEYLTTFYS